MQLKESQLSSQQTRPLIDCFVLRTTGRAAVAGLTESNCKTVTAFYHKLKEALAHENALSVG